MRLKCGSSFEWRARLRTGPVVVFIGLSEDSGEVTGTDFAMDGVRKEFEFIRRKW